MLLTLTADETFNMLNEKLKECQRSKSKLKVKTLVCSRKSGSPLYAFGFFACLSVWFSCMIPGLYEVIPYVWSYSGLEAVFGGFTSIREREREICVPIGLV
jgi:hypothetical protein